MRSLENQHSGKNVVSYKKYIIICAASCSKIQHTSSFMWRNISCYELMLLKDKHDAVYRFVGNPTFLFQYGTKEGCTVAFIVQAHKKNSSF